MSLLQNTFDKAVEYASAPDRGGTWPLTNDQKLTMYGCFKQVKVGPCQGDRPSMFNLTARSKYDAWKAASNLSKEQAMKTYISVVQTYAPDLDA